MGLDIGEGEWDNSREMGEETAKKNKMEETLVQERYSKSTKQQREKRN